MPLGTEVNLGAGDIVLDRVAALPPPPPKRGTASSFWPMSIVPNGLMDEDATWYGTGPWLRPHCVRWRPSSPRKRGIAAPHLFSAHVYCGHGRLCQLLLSSYVKLFL